MHPGVKTYGTLPQESLTMGRGRTYIEWEMNQTDYNENLVVNTSREGGTRSGGEPGLDSMKSFYNMGAGGHTTLI